MSDMLIDRLFLGAGAMKAGTTWLYSVLSRHPGIHFCPEKEIHYFYARAVRPAILSDQARLRNAQDKYLRFDPDRASASAVRQRFRWVSDYLDGPVDDHWYRSLFAARPAGAWAADFSNLYALLPAQEWARLANRVGELRVLYTMRDPVDRLWSHAKFHLKITGQADAAKTWSPDRLVAFVRQPFIWENAEYGAALRRLRAGLPEGSLNVLFHESLHADEPKALAEIERFLGLAHHTYPPDLLKRRINTTAPAPVPAGFRARLADDITRITDEVRAEGFALPSSWTTQSEAPAV